MANQLAPRVTCAFLIASLVACGDSAPNNRDVASADVVDAANTPHTDVAPDLPGDADAGDPLCPSPGASARVAESDDLIGGPRSQGRVGDLVLENPHARFVIQQPTDAIGIVSQYGGNLIDADVVRGDATGTDILGELGTLLNVAGTMGTTRVAIESPGAADEPAVVVAEGSYQLNGFIITEIAVEAVAGFNPFEGNVDPDTPWTLDLETRYTLEPCGKALRVEVTATNSGAEPTPFVLAWMIQGGLVDPFVPGIGFVNDVFGTADTVFLESNAAGIDVTYGLVPDVRDPARPLLGFNGALALMHDVSLLELLTFPNDTFTLDPGASQTLGAWFIVGDTSADAIATFNGMMAESTCAPFVGRVEEEVTGAALPNVNITTLEIRNGEPSARTVTNARSDEDGRFELCLPPGPAALIFGQDGRPYVGGQSEPTPVVVQVPDRDETPPSPDEVFLLPQTAELLLTIRDGNGAQIPARVSVLGVDPSPPDRRLDGDGFDPLPPGVVAMADTPGDPIHLLIEPGEIDLVVSRGIEWSLHRSEHTLSAGELLELAITLHHVVDTDGFLSGDFHVHAAPGPDSTITYDRRAINMAAEGVEVIVSTDHAFITDYGPTIERLGLVEQVVSLPGQEITTFASGHFGGFPMQPDQSPNGGAINWVGMDPVDISEEVHRRTPDGVFQIMHPRAIPAPGGGNYFTLLDLAFDETGPILGENALDPADVRLPPEARWLDPSFNAMEVVTFANVQGLADWMNLLNAGWRLTATGNSDTHTRWVEGSGYARNLVHVGAGQDTVSTFAANGFVRAVREGRNSVALGVFVDLVVNPDSNAGSIGDTVDVSGGEPVRARVRVQTPEWLRAERVAIYVGGEKLEEREATAERVELPTGGARHEYTEEFEFELSEDSWVAAVVGGSQSLYPLLPYNWAPRDDVGIAQIRANALPGAIMPFAVTNPVWLDVDGDGEVTPSHRVVPQDCQTYRRIDRSNPYVSVPDTNCGCVRDGGAPGCE